MTDEDLGVTVHVGITYDTGDGVHDHVDVPSNDPNRIAEAVMTALRGVAAMHGPDLQLALTMKMGEMS